MIFSFMFYFYGVFQEAVSCGLGEVMLTCNLLAIHNGDTQVCVTTAGTLWYNKDHLCLNQRSSSLCPSGILETRALS